MQLNQYKKVNKDIQYKINVLDKNLGYERRKTGGLRALSSRGENFYKKERDNYSQKKTQAMTQKQKRRELEREIYR